MTLKTESLSTQSLSTQTLDTPVGTLTLVADADTLLAVLWPEEREGRVKFTQDLAPASGHRVLVDTADQLTEYFAGERTVFDLPLRPRGTEFQCDVWWSLAAIPYGETSTYAKQAAEVGKPRAVRAVGSANGRNPLSIVLPCHRIIGADGSLAGFAGGLDTKRWLLDHEAANATQ